MRDYFGDIWYQRTVQVPRGWAGERIVLHFESATHRATVWVGDHEVISHEGGYTPFEADVTEFVTPGEQVRVTALVNNTLSFQSIPPGVIEDTAGGRAQRYWHDFFNFAGIHRSVWLADDAPGPRRGHHRRHRLQRHRRVGRLHGGRRPTPTASTSGSSLRDASGREVATGTGPHGTLSVEDVHLWAPGHGYLYDLEVQLVDDSDVVLDRYHQTVGIRTVEVRGTEFLINGDPFYFKGFGMHEDHSTIGKAHSPAHVVQDFELLDWIGANSFRTSHYPYSEDVLDYADRHGIVIIDETAAVGLNMGLGGGIFGGQGYTTFSPETINDATREVHAQAIRELIARDKNHPSVVLWSIANEPESDTEGAEDYFRPLFDVAREADPTRPVGFVNVMLAPHGTCRVSQFADVLMLNRYYGWYVNTGDLASAEVAWTERARGLGLRGQADRHHRVRRRHPRRQPLPHPAAVERGVPGRLPRDEPPRLRRVRRRRRRARVELRRLRDDLRHHARRRQQEGRLHPRPQAEGRRVRPAPPLAQGRLRPRAPDRRRARPPLPAAHSRARS